MSDAFWWGFRSVFAVGLSEDDPEIARLPLAHRESLIRRARVFRWLIVKFLLLGGVALAYLMTHPRHTG
jgi:hypothetical protein